MRSSVKLMKAVSFWFVLSSFCSLIASPAEGQTVTQYRQFSVDARAAYYTRGAGNTTHPPTSVAVGPGTDFPVGTKIIPRFVGDYRNVADVNAPEQPWSMGAVFRGSSGFMSPASGSTVSSLYSPPTCTLSPPHLSTDILEDFVVMSDTSGSTAYAIVPENATELLFAPTDCYYSDNVDIDGDYAVRLHIVLDVPENEKAKTEENKNDDSKDNRELCQRSSVSVDDQVLRESIPMPKSGLSLHYSSDRTLGYRPAYRMKVPIAGGTGWTTQIYTAGRQWTVPGTSSNTIYTLDWDGKDSLGNWVPTSSVVGIYRVPVTPAPGSWTQYHYGFLGKFNASTLGLGGWTLSHHHMYDVYARRLYLGSGGDRKANFFYTTNGLSVASSDGSEVYVFAAPQYRHVQTLNAKTGAVIRSFTYDVSGLLTEMEDAYGNVTSITRSGSGSGSTITIAGPYGQDNILEISASGYLESVTQPGGQVYNVVHTANGLLSSFQKPKGDTHNFLYDSLGRLISDESPLGRILSLTRSTDDMSSPITEKTSENRKTALSFGRSPYGGYVRTETLPHGEVRQSESSQWVNTQSSSDGTWASTTMIDDPRLGESARVPNVLGERKPSGLFRATNISKYHTLDGISGIFGILTETVDIFENGLMTRSEYRGSDRRTLTTSPMGRTSAGFMDLVGRITRQERAGVEPVDFTYDVKGRIASVVQGDRETLFGYDSSGNLQSVEDALGNVTSMTYDTNGKLLTTIKPDLSVTTYTHDLNSNITSIAPPGRPVHEMLFDALNRVIEMISPNLNLMNPVNSYRDLFTYNTDNEVTKITKAGLSVLDYEYQSGNERLNRIRTPSGNYEYTYLPNSKRLAEATSPYGMSTEFGYDGDLVTSIAQSGAAKGSVHFQYDPFFRVARSSVYGKDGERVQISDVEYVYDNDGFLIQAGPLVISRNLSTGFLASTSINGVTDSRTYNVHGEIIGYVANFDSSLLYSYSLTRDKLGRITKKIEDIGGVETTYDYVYNSVGRLIEVKTNGSTTGTYTYNSNGGRTMTSDHGHSHAGVFDDQDRMTQQGDLQFTYNLDGQLQSRTDSSISEAVNYVYDTQGNLLSAALPGSCTISYVTDGMNRRVAKKHNGDLEDQYVFEDNLRLAGKLTPAGNLVQRYVYGTMSHSPDVILENGRTLRVIMDHLGSPRLIVNSETGEILRSMNHDAWGRVLEDSNPMFSPHGFAGGIYDPDTKLVRFGARDYNPEAGSWTSKDPISFQGGDTNLFSYVLNDPINLIDPSGLAGFYVSVGGAAGVASGPRSRTGYVAEASSGIVIGSERGGIAVGGIISTGRGNSIVGATAGAGFNIGYFIGDVSGQNGTGFSTSYVFGPLSFSLGRDGNGTLTGFSFGAEGRGFGFSAYTTETYTETGAIGFGGSCK